ncbi:AAA family ATPase [Kitasatospora nipponensis]|uniref:AAA family ATPase n=1 Tax=Kitasatospora nipponensis TaxID=258049 RepID=A0ABN1WU42_9ACTN
MTDRAFVIISGLPASGKSTLARALAERMSLPLIDKDEILEALYESLGIGDHGWRHRLSRASDDVLFALAARAPGAVLDNWWHHETAPARLRELGGRLVEVFCDCDPAVAAERFQTRTRHPGHLDPQHTPEQVAERVAFLRATFPGPLRLGGPLLVVDTNHPVDPDVVTDQLDQLLTGDGQGN